MEQEQSEIDRAFEEIVANTSWEPQQRIQQAEAPTALPKRIGFFQHSIWTKLAFGTSALAGALFLFKLTELVTLGQQ